MFKVDGGKVMVVVAGSSKFMTYRPVPVVQAGGNRHSLGPAVRLLNCRHQMIGYEAPGLGSDMNPPGVIMLNNVIQILAHGMLLQHVVRVKKLQIWDFNGKFMHDFIENVYFRI